ncbi:radical SAM protein [Thermosulfurimonas marina]|uniref:Radical SAM protein n=1 Tax=Thermosulfurimonas marina TaxID=2047767 RepID=A0A6H1WR22_9BACT|nr:radical SAM protein [Thermosulfurimonas marina]QJA05631.1 radical SAM protein [Thermosulfurimonas marina]
MPVFGPVYSRRLGLSLGVDLVPPKICSMDCVYCEVGRTTRLTLERKPYVPLEVIEEALRRALSERECQVVTLTGSGEPTLNSLFAEAVALVRRLWKGPIAVLTNSTLLSSPEVFEALSEVDYVLASLDAARIESFRRVNRPAPGLSPESIVEDLARLRKAMRGELWLETLFVRGLNDSSEDLAALKEALSRVRPHRVQLNTVARPPAESWAAPLSYAELAALAWELGGEVLVSPPRRRAPGEPPSPEELVEYLRRRPAPAEELSAALGGPPEALSGLLEDLVKKGALRRREFQGQTFYEAPSARKGN